ncbi:trafficking protein particle complex subunit 13 [Caerostris extrusa]|uniref:Trafficking protein particle complex subunit 13 n=1 Tax=Caerostris extrusa TaxID=172846 RepID=A0AAV4NVE6_CAEEX|nr:trafficking protein particle complex subunit 13 [Caerostris extrusa]
MENREKEHLLALKVMRLTRPSLYSTRPISTGSNYFAYNLLNEELKHDPGSAENLECCNSGNLLMLPQSFGNIYLGETFSCYMSVHNDSQQTVTSVQVQADLQIGLQKNCSLACTVNYTTMSNEKLHFRKFFKFQVSKPLDVKTKFYNAEVEQSDEVYLEAPLQNITIAPMCLEKVALEPSANFTSRQLNTVETEKGIQPIFGEVNCLNPQDSWQYLFCLTPKPGTQRYSKLVKNISSIGKLDIVWRTSMGERGRLQTSQLERMTPGYGEIRLIITEIPSIVTLEKPFPVSMKIINACDRALDLLFTLRNSFSNGILWHGISGQKFNNIEKGSFVSVSLEAIPVKPGLQSVSGLVVKELFLKRVYNFNDVTQVFVTTEGSSR